MKTLLQTLNTGKGLVVLRIVSASLMFFALMLLEKSWTSEKLGIWILLFSLSNFIFVVSDFGLGQALRLYFARISSSKNDNDLQNTLNAAILFLFIIFLSLILGFVVYIVAFGTPTIIKTNDIFLQDKLNIVFLIFVILIFLCVPLQLINHMNYAFHEPSIVALYDFIRVLVIFILSLFANNKNFLVVVLLIGLSFLFTRIVQFFRFFNKRKWLFQMTSVKKIWQIVSLHIKKSLEFWVLGILYALQVVN
jgi:O-antigen/teichoic acid export membrane protein